MEQPETLEPLALPVDQVWSSVELIPGAEIHAGHQSRVFIADLDGRKVAVKLTDGRLVDTSFLRRIEALASLAQIDSSVVGPLALGSSLVTHLDGWLGVAYPFVEGEAPTVTGESDVRHMALTLAALHKSLAALGPVDLPAVAALRSTDLATVDAGFGRAQLLHGDFSHANTMLTAGKMHVIDFDDCGYGPVEFEVGNTLYMVLFDAWMASDMPRYERFRTWFVDEYRAASGHTMADSTLDEAIKLRVEALGRWVAQPDTAPIGIRTATPEWHRSLKAFVQSRV